MKAGEKSPALFLCLKMGRKRAVHGLVDCPLFCYPVVRKKVIPMYDNDIFLLLLDDDLFWVECGDTTTPTQQG